MKTVIVTRKIFGDDGTFGDLATDDGWSCHTGELPWRDNINDKSCIPEGTYECRWTKSNRLSKIKGEDFYTYEIIDVKDRGGIRIHSANFVGDDSVINPSTGKHFRCELKGCISPGISIGRLEGQIAVLQSHKAVHELERRMNKESFRLIIRREVKNEV